MISAVGTVAPNIVKPDGVKGAEPPGAEHAVLRLAFCRGATATGGADLVSLRIAPKWRPHIVSDSLSRALAGDSSLLEQAQIHAFGTASDVPIKDERLPQGGAS